MAKNLDLSIPQNSGFEDSVRSNFERDGVFFLHGEIDEFFSFSFYANLEKCIIIKSKEKTPDPIKIYITSIGGNLCSAFDTISLIEYSKKLNVPIHSYVFSNAISAASLIAVSCEKRFVSNYSSHLLHFATKWDISRNIEMAKNNLKDVEFNNQKILEIYLKYSKLDIDFLKQKLLEDNYRISGGTNLIDAGFADELINF